MAKYRFTWMDDDCTILATTDCVETESLTDALRDAFHASRREDGEGATQCMIELMLPE